MGSGQINGWVLWRRDSLFLDYFDLTPKQFKIWFAVVVLANWQPTQWRGEALKRGEFATSVQNLAKICGVTPKSVRCALGIFSQRGWAKITASRGTRWTRVLVLNYDSLHSSVEMLRNETGEEQDGIGARSGATGKETRNKKQERECGESFPEQPSLFVENEHATPSPNGSHVAAVTRRVLQYLNKKRNGPAGKSTLADEPYRDLVAKALKVGHTERELKLAVWWAADCEWPVSEESHAKRVHPNTLFPLRKPEGRRALPQYLDLAREAYRTKHGKEFDKDGQGGK